MKILYACRNSPESKIQCERFLQAVGSKYIIKISAYKDNSPNYNIDYTIDNFFSVFNPKIIKIEKNHNLEIYFNQIKKFKPDLIISDMEIFSSHIGNILNIPIWQCGSSIVNHAVPYKEKRYLKLFANYSFYFSNLGEDDIRNQYLLNSCEKKYIYSHFGDLKTPPVIYPGFEWIRPYHYIGKESKLCEHNLVCVTRLNNKKILDLLSRHYDSVCFTNFYNEKYKNVILKNINDNKEYICNLKNCIIAVNDGQISFLADAFYNLKYCLSIPDFKNGESIINSIYSEYFGLSKTIFDSKIDISDLLDKKIEPHYNNVDYLHEKIEKIYE